MIILGTIFFSCQVRRAMWLANIMMLNKMHISHKVTNSNSL